MSSISILVLTTLSSAMTGYSTVSSTLYSSMPVKWAGMILQWEMQTFPKNN